jgi:hypothetical protein
MGADTMTHSFRQFDFVPTSPSSWNLFPSLIELQRQISLAILADCEVADVSLGFYKPPKRIREIIISYAARDQITCMWHGHRQRGAFSPPVIPLRYFVFGFGQDPPDTWADVEVHPGLEKWEAL